MTFESEDSRVRSRNNVLLSGITQKTFDYQITVITAIKSYAKSFHLFTCYYAYLQITCIRIKTPKIKK